ncbi:Uncharacterized protein RNJ44_02776 [Nakaseomyces bracarensis]|uniref:2-hydroxyacid dehydrogenase n=1 Tax=Nakaseomyces bracarensis TaxID=273131 RepID=A0ABR4P071_9SACH
MTNTLPSILFIAAPNQPSNLIEKSPYIKGKYNLLYHILGDKDQFMKFLHENKHNNIVAIYGGYPAFHTIHGLTREIIEHEDFPLDTLKCITLSSRGVNALDLEALKDHGIQLFNYQDDVEDDDISHYIEDFQLGEVGNDVADSALWHVLEGFRKFSYQQKLLRDTGHTVEARQLAAHRPGKFAFGHELGDIQTKNGSLVPLYTESPRGKKVLILGFGSIGTKIAYKLQHGLGMEIHYSKRTRDEDLIRDHPDWHYHPMDPESLYPTLSQFHAIIIALPGTPETKGLINREFLSHCQEHDLIIVNLGRGFILDMEYIDTLLKENKIRHLAVDVFPKEPIVDALLTRSHHNTTITPHMGSATRQVFTQSCELALTNIIKATTGQDTSNSPCRVL